SAASDVYKLLLCDIPYGICITYGELAALIGDPKACRAVGMANGRNPLPIIVPCHRVIGSGGKLTGYTGGLDIKIKLLQIEGITLFG
ncbi:MAG: MGMT family protein, partial [Odoribacter sp.]|nr:MGMT family protein [Odoribacter sp.]